MAAVEPAAEELFVGLENAEARDPERWVRWRARAENIAVVALIVLVQLAWFSAFAYAAYRFISSA